MRHQLKIKISPFYYTLHAMRTRGTADLARMGYNALYMKKFGRSKTNGWQKVHVKLEFSNLAKLRGETMPSIGKQMKNVGFK